MPDECLRARGGRAEWQYAVAVYPGQWHWVADRYREWAVHHFDRPRYPKWFAQSDGYFMFPIMNTRLPFKDLGKVATKARRIGLKHIQIWGQFTAPGDGCCGPYWMPSPRYGTIDEFKKGIADIHAQGCKVGFYFVHDRVDLYHPEGNYIYGFIAKSEYPPGTEFPTREFVDKVQLVTNPDGTTRAYPLSREQWAEYYQKVEAYKANPRRNKPPHKWQPVDLADPDWWEYMRHWAIDKYVEQWGADGHYYDVLGCGQARESFDLRKGHHGHGLCGIGRAGIARTTVQSAFQRGHEDYFLLQEGLCDIPGQYTGGMNTSLYYNQTSVMRYTWPDFVMFDDQAGQGARNCMRVVEMGFLNGNRMGIRISNHVMAQFVEARARIREWLNRGRFMHTLGLESPVPARLFIRRDAGARGAIATFLNRDGVRGTARLDLWRVGNVQRAVGIDGNGGTFVVPLTRERDKVAFPVSIAHISAVVMAEDVDVAHGVLGGIRLNREEKQWTVAVTVANLTGATIRGTIALRDFGPFKAPAKTPAFSCSAGEVARLVLPVDASAGRGKFVRLSADVMVNDRPVAHVETSSFPCFEDPSFEETGNDDREAYAGAKSLRLDPTKGPSRRRFDLYLKPARRYRLSLMYKRTACADRGNFARIFEHRQKTTIVPLATLRFTKEDEWARSSAEFVTAPRFLSTSLYIYNNTSRRTVWIDDVRVEDMGRAPRPRVLP